MATFERLGWKGKESLRQARILGAYLNGAGLAIAAWRKSQAEDTGAGGSAVDADLKYGVEQLLVSLMPPLPAPQQLR